MLVHRARDLSNYSTQTKTQMVFREMLYKNVRFVVRMKIGEIVAKLLNLRGQFLPAKNLEENSRKFSEWKLIFSTRVSRKELN